MRKTPKILDLMPPQYRGDASQAWMNLADQPLKKAYAAVRDFHTPWLSPGRLWAGPNPDRPVSWWSDLTNGASPSAVAIILFILHIVAVLALLGLTRLLSMSLSSSWITTGRLICVFWLALLCIRVVGPWRAERRRRLAILQTSIEEVEHLRTDRLRTALSDEIDKLRHFARERCPSVGETAPFAGLLAELRTSLRQHVDGTSLSAPKEVLRQVEAALMATINVERGLRASISPLCALAQTWHAEQLHSLDVRNALNKRLNAGVMAIQQRVRERCNANEAVLKAGYDILSEYTLNFGPPPSAETAPNPADAN